MFEEVLDNFLIELEAFEKAAFPEDCDLSQVPFAELNQSPSPETNAGPDESVELNESQMSRFNDAELVEVDQY